MKWQLLHPWRAIAIFAVLSLPISASAQIEDCPSNSGQCGVNCCEVDNATSFNDCANTSATFIYVDLNNQNISGFGIDLSGTTVCLNNNSLSLANDVIVDSGTAFDAGGNDGITVNINGIDYDFTSNGTAPNDLTTLNNELAGLSGSGTIGDAISFLPVELLAFTGRPMSDYTIINWATATESGNSHFLLEHSTNGRDFRELAQVNGQGDSYDLTEYSHKHLEPAIGENYYRLWQYDFDGTFAMLGIIQLRISGSEQLVLAPNPIRKGQQLFLPGEPDDYSNAVFTLHAVNGQSWVLNRQQEMTINLPAELTAGLYYLQVNGASTERIASIQIID